MLIAVKASDHTLYPSVPNQLSLLKPNITLAFSIRYSHGLNKVVIIMTTVRMHCNVSMVADIQLRHLVGTERRGPGSYSGGPGIKSRSDLLAPPPPSTHHTSP
jgi:hypothetical protein